MTNYREPNPQLLKSELGKRLYQSIYGGVPIVPENRLPVDDIPPPPRRVPEPSARPPAAVVRQQFALPANYVPSLATLVNFYRDFGVVDEEKTCVLLTLAMVHGLHVGVEGPSGSGKSYIVQGLSELLPKEQVYTLELASDKAVFYDAVRVNNARFLIAPELQKPLKEKNGSTIEVLKTLSEGRDLDRLVTQTGGQVRHQVISGKNKVILYTLAMENSFKKDAELSRRFIVLYTDTSDEHVQHVLQESAMRQFADKNKNLDILETASLKRYLSSLIALQDVKFRDPFAVFMRRYIPQIPRAVSFVNHYDHLLNAFTKFYHPVRLRDGKQVFTALEDHYQLFTLYHENFMQNLFALGDGHENMQVPAVDWEGCFRAGLEAMIQQYPSFADQWLEKHIVDNQVVVHHPLTGDVVPVAS
ncbi:MAG: hypothetical protein Q7R96_01600 [Nanoarchaeota archaeon]|nr:hypothetical protein [Nanoarchaeota archaeon]